MVIIDVFLLNCGFIFENHQIWTSKTMQRLILPLIWFGCLITFVKVLSVVKNNYSPVFQTVNQARSQRGGGKGGRVHPLNLRAPRRFLHCNTNLGLVKCSRMCICNLETRYMRLCLPTRLDTLF